MDIVSDLNHVGVATIRVFSTMNTWMDCVFLVSKEDKEEAIYVLERAWNEFWKQNDTPYVEWLEIAMYEAGIEYEVFYAREEEE